MRQDDPLGAHREPGDRGHSPPHDDAPREAGGDGRPSLPLASPRCTSPPFAPLPHAQLCMSSRRPVACLVRDRALRPLHARCSTTTTATRASGPMAPPGTRVLRRRGAALSLPATCTARRRLGRCSKSTMRAATTTSYSTCSPSCLAGIYWSSTMPTPSERPAARGPRSGRSRGITAAPSSIAPPPSRTQTQRWALLRAHPTPRSPPRSRVPTPRPHPASPPRSPAAPLPPPHPLSL